MTARDLVSLRRYVIRQQIARHGGRYITPKQNSQPVPALRIASIHLGGMTGIGATEAAAQADWLRQAVHLASGPAVRT